MANAQFSFAGQHRKPKSNLRLLRATIWLITIYAGLTETWASRFSINPDGNSYLDIASAYLRGDWGNAINAYWSPLYSWLAAVCLGVFRLGSYWESTALHILNFVGLLLSLCTFEFFFRGFLRLQNQWRSPQEEEQPLPELAWWALGYALFLSTSLLVLTVAVTTPDVWVAMFTYLVAGLTLRIAINSGGWQLFAALGFALGCSYLIKTFYFPMSFVFLATAWLATGNPRKTMKQAVLGLLVFTLVAEGLRRLGTQPGDRVVGLSRVAEAHWARLAGVKIVAEIPLGDESIFWAATPSEKQKVFQAFASTGARFVVTKNPPACAQADGWVPLGRTGFYAFRLPLLAQSGSLTDATP